MGLLLLEALEPAEAAALRAHLASGCVRCASHLAEAEAMLTYLPYALEMGNPSSGARDRLMDRIAGHPAISSPHRGRAPARRGAWWRAAWVRFALPPAVAACITFAVTAKMMLRVQHDHEAVYQNKLASAQRDIGRKDQELREISGNLLPIALSNNPQRKMIVLEGRTQLRAAGRAIWDEQRQAWHFFAYNLDQVGPKEAYELWFVTPYGRKVPVTRTFRPNDMGYVHLVVTLPKDTGPVNACFITDEPAVGTFGPTGSIHLFGKLD
jgi:hypothetical protein